MTYGRNGTIEQVAIRGPYGSTDHVQRRAHPLGEMRKRRFIDDHQLRAGEKYQAAWQTLHASGLHCALSGDFGTLGFASRIPTAAACYAADVIRQAERNLYAADVPIVRLVVGNGETIKEAALHLGRSRRREIELIGDRLKHALIELAKVWGFGEPLRHRGHFQRTADARPQELSAGNILPAKVAHASRRGVAYA